MFCVINTFTPVSMFYCTFVEKNYSLGSRTCVCTIYVAYFSKNCLKETLQVTNGYTTILARLGNR